MTDLLTLARGYLESAGFRVLLLQDECLVVDKLVFGQERDTLAVWTIPARVEVAHYESTLRASISRIKSNYPDIKGYVLTPSRSGFSRDLIQTFKESGVRLLVPVWFFDTAFKHEDAPKAASAIKDIRSLATAEKRVPQPFRIENANLKQESADLFEALNEEFAENQSATVRMIVGRAGIGKSFHFRALFSHLYDDFLNAKNHSRIVPRPIRPIPLLPEHLRNIYALRTELLIDNFLRTDVAAPVDRKTFEWLLVNGFTMWLLDGLDELYAGDPDFFYYLLELLTAKESKAQITIWCRDSLLTTSDAFMEFESLCATADITMLEIYHLSEWEQLSKQQFAWLNLEERMPETNEEDTRSVRSFLGQINQSPTLRLLSGLPFYCDLLLRQFQDGQLREFSDDITMLNYAIDQIVEREVEKGLLDLRLFMPDGLHEWLEQIAVDYIEKHRYAGINHEEALEYGQLVLQDGLDEDTINHTLISLLQFPLFHAGAETGLIAFTHDLIAEVLAARSYVRTLRRQPFDVGRRLSHTDLEDPTFLRFMVSRIGQEEEDKIIQTLRRGNLEGKGFAVLLSLLMLARPERNIVKQIQKNFDAQNMVSVHFENRDLSEISFRNADLSHAVFKDCELQGAQFEGTFFYHTRFEGNNQLQGAQFGDLGRVNSVLVEKKYIENPLELNEWISQETGKSEVPRDPCPTALQLTHLFGKFITPLGQPRRADLKRDGLAAGKRYRGAASTEACISDATRHGYLTGPDQRDRFRRAEGDKYAEMVKFVRNGSISDGLGRLVAGLCPRRGCMHQIRH